MTRRSPMNDRYRAKKPAGRTATSAARAKPKREAGESSGSTAARTTASKSPGKPGREDLRIEPTPEMRRLQRYWMIAIGTAFVLATVSFAGPWLGLTWIQKDKVVFYSLLGAYVIAIGIALWIDAFPLKKARREAAAAAKVAKKGRS